MKISSTTETVSATPEKMFNLIVSFAHTDQVPAIPQVSDWTNIENGFRFTIAGMITCTMQIAEQRPFSLVEYKVSSDKGISATAIFHIEDAGGLSQVNIEADVDAPIFMQGMIKNPLEKAMNTGLAKLKEMAERI